MPHSHFSLAPGIMEDNMDDDSNLLDDEINNLLLKHERRNTQQQAAVVPGAGGGDDSDSDARYLRNVILVDEYFVNLRVTFNQRQK